ncbi:hypothetical protein SARC_06425 [Sphaeroforma arctica JP610]|uniref:Protein kinase domain-containing protein n=1 Tax=Sphaeroforma arctica JP610 TaxID=667725 RepID=A0A0L0FWN6_9EUKA|nr:hypothetical protein SARC_06425 [Sphaeroforma arctica JP610]KNC81250.1 hypothetical protein SARC_06425 [Sphaeroforma arctica JP610]|eukprot:XP_014155152.1 hypothetical protein SARC_06425 [Sphaeroforma arctica JP610]
MFSQTTFKRWVAKSVQGKDAQQYYSQWPSLYYLGGIFLDDNEVRNGLDKLLGKYKYVFSEIEISQSGHADTVAVAVWDSHARTTTLFSVTSLQHIPEPEITNALSTLTTDAYTHTHASLAPMYMAVDTLVGLLLFVDLCLHFPHISPDIVKSTLQTINAPDTVREYEYGTAKFDAEYNLDIVESSIVHTFVDYDSADIVDQNFAGQNAVTLFQNPQHSVSKCELVRVFTSGEQQHYDITSLFTSGDLLNIKLTFQSPVSILNQTVTAKRVQTKVALRGVPSGRAFTNRRFMSTLLSDVFGAEMGCEITDQSVPLSNRDDSMSASVVKRLCTGEGSLIIKLESNAGCDSDLQFERTVYKDIVSFMMMTGIGLNIMPVVYTGKCKGAGYVVIPEVDRTLSNLMEDPNVDLGPLGMEKIVLQVMLGIVALSYCDLQHQDLHLENRTDCSRVLAT